MLPVAEIFSFERVEVIGREAVVTVLIGDEKCPPHNHGLRAPAARWVEIFAALAADPELHAKFALALVTAPSALPEHRAGVPVRLAEPAKPAASTYAPEGDRPASEDRDNAFFKRPVTKPNGELL